MREENKCILICIVLVFLMAEAVLLTEPPLVYLILFVAGLGFIFLGLSSSLEEDLIYCVIILHHDKIDYAEVIYCPDQVPDEAVYSGSFKECEKWANGFNETE